MTFGKFGGLRHNPAASLTACEQGASRKLAPEEVDDDAIRLEARYIRHWGNFAWRGDPNIDGGGAQAEGEARWPPRGAGGETLVFDAPSCRAGGREALPGQALWAWLGKHGLHEAYARAKARIL